MSDKNKTITMPEPYSRQKLAALYKTLSISNETVKLLRKYLKAMTNLYGVIPLDKVYEIISSQNPGLLTEAEFTEYIMVARHEQEYFTISGQADLYTGSRFRSLKERELIDIILLFEDEELLQRTFQMQADKPYYIPEKNILLRYHDEFYAEPTPQSKAMKRFLQDKLHFDAEGAQNIFMDLLLITRGADFSMNDISKYLEDNRLIFTSTKDAEEFFNIYTDLHNHTRMQYNRGHTPSEIAAMPPHHEDGVKSISFGLNIRKQIQNGTMDDAELFNGILTMDLPNEDLRKNMLAQLAELKKEMSADSPAPTKQPKIGRNDPCPCGSGKKYKKCCGR